MQFEYLVRGIIFAGGKVLLVRQKDGSNTFLPGGHIEAGERAESALVREIGEELGETATIKNFVGAVEHAWIDDGRAIHEINLVFEAAVPDLDSRKPPESLEPHLEFVWADLSSLETLNLQPYPLRECLRSIERGYNGFWGTSLEETV
ncbi:NUDIX domain-containing protein [Candidatus Eisenbacteria bacterium]|uniref:NUDIX domain-containing protein n=1 Tax=Eiseniibacteriota bacterium TaxID=2212470 RepID=A0ABV6YMT3_UNCEI